MLDNGDSTLIVTPQNKTILIDGGGKENYDTGERVLIPFILNKRIIHIDYIIVSHFDLDHVGGLLTVMEKISVGQVIISKQAEESENYKRFKQIVKDKKIKVQVVGINNEIQKIKIEEDLYFDILWPNNGKMIEENPLNNNSIVCKLNYKKFSVLFTGDIEELAEKEIVKQYKYNLQILKSTILKVGHHGSKSSSIKKFIDIVKPEVALIGVGKNNKFGHPNEEVIERLKIFGTKIYRTDEMGEIILKVNKEGKYNVSKYLS